MIRLCRTAFAIASVASAIGLQGCGGGGGGGGGGAAPPPPPAVVPGGALPSSYQGLAPEPGGATYYTVNRVTAPGAYAYPGGNAVRIGIRDDAVDFTHSAFRGRIVFDGASFSYRRGDITSGNATDEFDDCKPTDRCRVYLVDSRGDRSRLEALARTVLQAQGLPPDNNRWYLYDTAPNGFGWSELPALGLSGPDDADAQHGTAVASVAAAQAPDSAIVPIATNFDEQFVLTVTVSGGTVLKIVDDPFLEDSLLELAGTRPLSEIDDILARAIRRWHESVDIVNSSYSVAVDILDPDGQDERDEYIENVRQLRTRLPERWKAYTQSDRPEGQRTIRVLAAGNARDDLGAGARSLYVLEIFHFPELRGHTVAVTALNRAQSALADYANVCGALPSGWDASRHGRHFCLAAPGTHVVAVPGGTTQLAAGTSYAAPYVAGVLARMMAQFRGQVGNTALVKRMMDTADNTGVFADTSLYGAGVVDPAAALAPVGTLTTGTHSNRARLESTRLRMPAAYGDAAGRVAETEVASFDAWDFPFWTPASDLIEDGEHTVDPIPTFAEPGLAGDCFLADGYAPDAACVPFVPDSERSEGFSGAAFGAAAGRVNGLAAADGAGVTASLSEGITVAGFARGSGRLDGRASGAFSFAGGSSLGAVRVARRRAVDEDGRWSVDGQLAVAFDSPEGFGRSEGTMFEAGPALLSSWAAGVTHAGDDGRTRLAVTQPPRAERGTGRLTYPSGRRLDGTHVYETRTFSLRPSRRMVTASLSHRRPFAGGEVIVSVQRTENPGHAIGRAEHGGGIAWRLTF